jgi:transposase
MAPSKKKGDPWRLSDSSVKLATELMQSGEFMQTEIAVLSGISVRSVQTIARNFRRHGQATNAGRKKPGRLNLLSDEVLDDLTEWLLNRPSTGPTYLNEMKRYLIENFGVEASLSTIHRSLSNAGVVQTKSVWRKVPPIPSAHGNVEHDSTVVIVEHDTTEPAGIAIDETSISSNDSPTALPQSNSPQADIFMTSAYPGT